jgi:hypothetical protein
LNDRNNFFWGWIDPNVDKKNHFCDWIDSPDDRKNYFCEEINFLDDKNNFFDHSTNFLDDRKDFFWNSFDFLDEKENGVRGSRDCLGEKKNESGHFCRDDTDWEVGGKGFGKWIASFFWPSCPSSPHRIIKVPVEGTFEGQEGKEGIKIKRMFGNFLIGKVFYFLGHMGPIPNMIF